MNTACFCDKYTKILVEYEKAVRGNDAQEPFVPFFVEVEKIMGWKKIRTWVFNGVALLFLMAVIPMSLVIFFSSDRKCENRIVTRTEIPSGNLMVVTYLRNCGAARRVSTNASILQKHEELPDKPGNIFIADTDNGKAPSGPEGGLQLHVTVVAADMLELAYDERARVFSDKREYHNIKIRYKRLSE